MCEATAAWMLMCCLVRVVERSLRVAEGVLHIDRVLHPQQPVLLAVHLRGRAGVERARADRGRRYCTHIFTNITSDRRGTARGDYNKSSL